MAFFKHVGKVNGKKAIIMQTLESEQGQSAFEFKDVLQRRMMADGQNMLEALSSEGYLKRVTANSVMVTPNAKSSMRLDELSKLLNEVGRGEDAVKRLERMENSQGIGDPAKAALTDAVVSESVNLGDMGIDITAENAKLNAIPVATAAPVAAPDQTALMMQMMQTMQAMQQQINEMRGSPATVSKSAKTTAKKTTKTAARA